MNDYYFVWYSPFKIKTGVKAASDYHNESNYGNSGGSYSTNRYEVIRKQKLGHAAFYHEANKINHIYH